MVSGMERADSLALDLHKWMYMQYEIGCIFVRHPEQHKKPSFYDRITWPGWKAGAV